MAGINYSRVEKLKEFHKKEIENIQSEKSAEILLLKSKIEDLSRKVLILEELKHDIGRLAMESLSFSEDLNNLISRGEDKDRIESAALTIHHSLTMVSPRIVYSDMELANGQVNNSARFNAVVYKKFDKARKILKSKCYKRKVSLKFNGNSKFTIRAMSSFDIVPFLILDNAIKYSPKDNEIIVSFDTLDDSQSKLDVIITSIGPFVNATDLARLTDRGFRCDNTLIKKTEGQGLGLYIVKNICAYHGVSIKFSSEYSCDISNVKYGVFTVTLSFEI
ncbi:ATP-binding protein [Edwardsiella piscicida]|uniref:ATP-binding protein n=1 Tax=Edwardsiella piscicida TaxID=1263550 RepID=UPI00084CBBE1|nr:ATP-binding protein [Edwardsiella piscicida]AOP42913.1 ATP-binding protein [Edwardsiella piscicida]EKS7767241.1 ATP-binding protein [Edwardsiella piscicida]UCQ32711.1 ATP-binding protein [Edwardsiella piscicida]UCQ59028.1 ATP-binding protein [Edwardsiella piscicida]